MNESPPTDKPREESPLHLRLLAWAHNEETKRSHEAFTTYGPNPYLVALLREAAAVVAPSAALTPEEAAEAAKSVRNGINPAGKMFIPQSWNVILDKLDAIALGAPASSASPSNVPAKDLFEVLDWLKDEEAAMKQIAVATNDKRATRAAKNIPLTAQLLRAFMFAPSATSPSNWVPSIERTPRDHEHVLGWIVGGSLHHDEDYMDIVMYLNGLFRMCNGTEDEPVPVTHWMPMPESPSRAEGAAK